MVELHPLKTQDRTAKTLDNAATAITAKPGFTVVLVIQVNNRRADVALLILTSWPNAIEEEISPRRLMFVYKTQKQTQNATKRRQTVTNEKSTI